MKHIIILLISMLALVACKKPTTGPVPSDKGSVSFEFSHTWNGQPFVLYNKFVAESGDTVIPSKLNYYITNIKLRNTTTGTWYAVPESYQLVRFEEESSYSFRYNDIPPGTYDSLQFYVGVDSARNHTGAQTGALDPIYGMFWTWNTGYIFYKLEGFYKPAGATTQGALVYHSGGIDYLKTISLPISQNVIADDATSIAIICDVSEVFKTPNTINISTLNTAHGPNAGPIADNYSNAFSIFQPTP